MGLLLPFYFKILGLQLALGPEPSMCWAKGVVPSDLLCRKERRASFHCLQKLLQPLPPRPALQNPDHSAPWWRPSPLPRWPTQSNPKDPEGWDGIERAGTRG